MAIKCYLLKLFKLKFSIFNEVKNVPKTKIILFKLVAFE